MWPHSATYEGGSVPGIDAVLDLNPLRLPRPSRAPLTFTDRLQELVRIDPGAVTVTPVDSHRITPHQVHGQWPDIVTHGCRIEQLFTRHLVSAHGTRTSETQLTGRIVPDVIAAPGYDDLAIAAIDALWDGYLDHLIHPL